MRLGNTSRLFIAFSAMLVSVFMTAQDADAISDKLFALGREPGGNSGTSLIDVTPSAPFAPTVIGMTADAYFSGLAFEPGTGTLYVSSGSNGTANGTANGANLFTMDPSTGVPTLVDPGAAGFGTIIQDLAFDAAGVLYGNDNDQLYTIDLTTGVATATSGLFHGGTLVDISMNTIAVDPTTDTLYGVSWDDLELFTIDTTTGAATSLGLLSGLDAAIDFTDPSGLAFDSTGALYVSTGSQVGDIYALDITDLTVATLVGNVGDTLVANGGTDISSVSGLAFAPVPEPSALALLILGAIGLGALRTRKS